MVQTSQHQEAQNFSEHNVSGCDFNLLVTVSGGRSSARMARFIQQSEKYSHYNKIYVFCNTGMERPETIEFLKDIEKHWGIDLIKIEGVYSSEMGIGVNYKIVDWDTLNMTAEPFSGAIMQMNKGEFKGMPSKDAPYCSSRLKTLPAHKLAKEIFKGDYISAVGFRAEDMPKRISWAEIKEDKKRIFPLLTDFPTPVTISDLNEFYKYQPFKLALHGKFGNCELCWKKSDHVLVENIKKGTRFIEWYKKHENETGNTSFRGNKSISYYENLALQPSTGTIDFGNEDMSCLCTF